MGALSAVGGAVTALVAGGVGILSERFKADRERTTAREGSFENAQDGYRKCYRKFLDGAVACLTAEKAGQSGPAELRELYRCFDEACLAGDPLVPEESISYWPLERRNSFQPPEEMPPAQLIRAMSGHGYRSLPAQDEIKKTKELRDQG